MEATKGYFTPNHDVVKRQEVMMKDDSRNSVGLLAEALVSREIHSCHKIQRFQALFATSRGDRGAEVIQRPFPTSRTGFSQ
jgi:hypothetical protein